jgi:hypothetical protein
VLAGTVRRGDVLARLGGDEFGIVAVGATPEQAGELVAHAERAMAAAGVAGSFGHAPYSVVTGFPGAWQAADEADVRTEATPTGRRPPARLGPGPPHPQEAGPAAARPAPPAVAPPHAPSALHV